MNARVTYTQKWLGEILTDTYYKTIDGYNIGQEVFNIKEALFTDSCVKSVKVEVEIEEGKWMEF